MWATTRAVNGCNPQLQLLVAVFLYYGWLPCLRHISFAAIPADRAFDIASTPQ